MNVPIPNSIKINKTHIRSINFTNFFSNFFIFIRIFTGQVIQLLTFHFLYTPLKIVIRSRLNIPELNNRLQPIFFILKSNFPFALSSHRPPKTARIFLFPKIILNNLSILKPNTSAPRILQS